VLEAIEPAGWTVERAEVAERRVTAVDGSQATALDTVVVARA
jgi:hypothetical protein